VTQLSPTTTWPAATRARVAAAIIDVALPTQDYVFASDDVLDFLVERLSPAFSLLKVIYGIDNEAADEKRPMRRPRKPTLANIAKQANKAAIAVARYEIKTDGTVVVVTGAPEPTAPENPWPLDEFQSKDIKQ
jgi:hypothetical protein